MLRRIKNKKGITLIETIINIYVYVLLVTVCMSVAISYIKGRVEIRQRQQAVEEISLAINEIGKIVRMSNCPSSDNRCVQNIKRLILDPNAEGMAERTYEIIVDGLYVDG